MKTPRTKKAKPQALPDERETDVLRGILDLLGLLQIPAFRSNAGGGYQLGKAGKPQLIRGAPEDWPDITGWLPHAGHCRGGRILLIEVKKPAERPTAGQVETMRACNRDGGVAFWTADVRQCSEILQTILQGGSIDMSANGDQFLLTPNSHR